MKTLPGSCPLRCLVFIEDQRLRVWTVHLFNPHRRHCFWKASLRQSGIMLFSVNPVSEAVCQRGIDMTICQLVRGHSSLGI